MQTCSLRSVFSNLPEKNLFEALFKNSKKSTENYVKCNTKTKLQEFTNFTVTRKYMKGSIRLRNYFILITPQICLMKYFI